MTAELPAPAILASASDPVRNRVIVAVVDSAEQALRPWRERHASPTWRAAMVGQALVGQHPTGNPQWYDRPGGGVGVLSVPDPLYLPPVTVGGSRAGVDTPDRRRWAYLAVRLAELNGDVATLLAAYREAPPSPIQVVVPWYLYAELLADAGIDPEPGMERWPCGSP